MDNQSARDPYLALNQLFRDRSREVQLPGHALGQVLSTKPLRVRAEGLDLDAEDLRVAWHLTDGWMQQLLTSAAAFPPEVQPPALKAGDTVLLLPSEDRQIYYILDKFVEVV